MSLLQEATLERLWSKYESRFGAPPPIDNASFDEAISLIREHLKHRPSGLASAARKDDDSVSTAFPLAAQIRGELAALHSDMHRQH